MKTRLTIAILALGIALTGCNLVEVEVEACNKRGGDAGPSCHTIFVPIQKQSR